MSKPSQRSRHTSATASGTRSATRPVQYSVLATLWLGLTYVTGRAEYERTLDLMDQGGSILAWFTSWNPEVTPVFVVLVMLPFLLWLTRLAGQQHRRKSNSEAQYRPFAAPAGGYFAGRGARVLTCLLLFCTSLTASAAIGLRQISTGPQITPGQVRFVQLPPTYHDEFSYLLQARTFLAGRLSWPAATESPELFHQYHVLNEPRTASRYFPFTGAWIAPFESLGFPFGGHWLAGALACVFFYLSSVQIIRQRWAFVAGLLIAVSPGIAVFSNLLLAHHPTMFALSVFLWAFLRLMYAVECVSTGHRPTTLAAIAGTFLALAMLARPMTAAGFALPFGVWFVASWNRSRLATRKSIASASPADVEVPQQQVDFRCAAAMGIPLVLAFCVLGILNHNITGSWARSAYQLYTDVHTPQHRYGFDNRKIGEQLAGPKRLAAYDNWAANLTPKLAATNVQKRLLASSIWTLGLFPIVLGVVMSICHIVTADAFRSRLILVLLSVFSLHVVHVPYWYDGILEWHYVFETAPLLLILTAAGCGQIEETLKRLTGSRTARSWIAAMLLAGLLPGWIDADSLWGPSRVSQAVNQQSFSRVRMYRFRQLTASLPAQHPLLVMVDERSSDPQLSYIVNPPDLTGDVLVCRLPAADAAMLKLRSSFPDREFWRFDPQTFAFNRLEGDVDESQNPLRAD